MQVKVVTEKAVWEDFVTQEGTRSFLQSWNWGVVNEKRGEKIWRLGVYKEDTLHAVALVIKVSARRGNFLFVPHGPIFSVAADTEATLEALTTHLAKEAKKERCCFVRISSQLPDTEGNNEIFEGLGYKDAPIHMMHPEYSWMLDVTKDEAVLMKEMRKNTRYYVRKAEKNVTLIELSEKQEGVEVFWKIYEQTAKRHSFTPFTKSYIKTEFETFQKDNQAAFIFARHQGEVVAAALIIFYGNQAFYHHGASIRRHKDLATTSYLLQWEAIKEAKRRGMKLYNFWGIAKNPKKKHPWHGITVFKKGFGGFAESYVHAKDYIITPRYWVAYIIERLRRIKRGY